MADRFYSDLLPDLTRALRDPHWRVRDAAVQAMLPFGTSGLNELYRVFLETEDEETGQQITDGLQRAGAMPTLLASLATDSLQSTVASAVCQKMAMLGQTVYLNRALASVDEPNVRLGLMDALIAGARRGVPSACSSPSPAPTAAWSAARASDILRLVGHRAAPAEDRSSAGCITSFSTSRTTSARSS